MVVADAGPLIHLEAYLKLPVPQRRLVRETILTFAKVHGHGAGSLFVKLEAGLALDTGQCAGFDIARAVHWHRSACRIFPQTNMTAFLT